MKKFVITVALALLSLAASAQGVFSLDTLQARYSLYTTWCTPEKVYLHIDRTCYTVGETIWFKGYLRNSSDATHIQESNFIYVELLDGEGKSVERVKIKRDSTGFPGSLVIPEDLSTGFYTLRSYSLWQMNSPCEYMFNQQIKIVGARPFEDSNPGHAGDVDVSFYPEGGRYFVGNISRIAFKAMDSRGRSVELGGFLMTDRGDTLSMFRTRHDGMGVLNLIPEKGTGYHLLSDDGKEYPLPEPSSDGAAVGVMKQREYVQVTVTSERPGGDYTLLVRDPAEIRPLHTVHMDSNSVKLRVDEDSFRPGINHMLLVDGAGNVISERLFYIEDKAESGIACSYSSRISDPLPRQLIRSSLSLSDADGNPLDGRFSISVVRGSLRRHVQDDGLVSYYRLSGELRGHVNNPSYYFDPSVPEVERRAALDLLLMVQGWSYYDMPQISRMDGAPFELRYMREYTQNIYGHVDRPLSEKAPEKFEFMVMIPKKNAFMHVPVLKGKSFTIDSLDFEKGTGILVNISRNNKLGLSYLPVWDGDIFAPDFKYAAAPGIASAVGEKIEVPLVSSVTDTITAAVVTASEFNDDAARHFISARAMTDLEIFRDRQLIDYLRISQPWFEYDGEYMVNKTKNIMNGTDSVGISDGMEPKGVVKLIVDGVEQPWWLFETVEVENFTSIAVSKQPESIFRADGGIVSVCVRPGAQLNSSRPTKPSMIYFVPLGYETPSRFYSPRYDRGDKDDAVDMRNTVFWSPSVEVKDGAAEVDFCNTDQKDYPFVVRIEGITSDGRMFSHHCILDLHDRQ